MPAKNLDPHQVEAVDAIIRALEFDATRDDLPEGLRAQVVMATGSGKTLVAAHAADRLQAGRVLVLVPSLDLLAQTVAAWREGGWGGPVIGGSSLRGDEVGFPNTTDADELVAWTGGLERVLVVATYASLGLGLLARAHEAGLARWDLIVVDEAHRTSGRIGKPWAAVHDNARIPARRRLYMTATPRLWQTSQEEQDQAEAGSEGELIASMEDDPAGPFGAVCYRLTLSEAIDRGIVAPYQVVCVDVTDTAYQAALLLGENARSDAIRGARIAALQTALIKAAAEENFTRTLTFHHLVKEAEAFAAGLPDVARQLWQDDPGLYPRSIMADWLHGEHKPAHRRGVLRTFASGIGADGAVVEKCFLCSVKVLGEGVDTRECDSVYFADVRGSMPDLVQAVGRALRMRPGEGKVASLVVPVLLAPGETPESLLTSRSYGALAKLLEALRAHDARVVETLAQPQAPSRYTPVSEREKAMERAGGGRGVSAAAAGLLKFSTPRDPAQLAAFIDLRVINPEREHWRRGMQAALAYARDVGDLRVPVGFTVPATAPAAGASEGVGTWPAGLAGFPLGQWVRDARKAYTAGRLEEERVAMLEKLGMVWNHFDVAFEEGLSAVRAWAGEHGHALAPRNAVGPEGFPVGEWLHNARAAARRARENERRRAEGLPVPASRAWQMSIERREALEEIDPSWCPAWSTGWQRRFTLTRAHLQAGGTLPTGPGQLLVQGEDLGRWVATQPRGWDKLAPAQRWMLEEVLGIEAPAEEAPTIAPKLNRAQQWQLNLTAARQYREREGHLNVPRQHTETVVSESATGGVTEHRIALGKVIANCRSRAATLPPDRHADLDTLGMRWGTPLIQRPNNENTLI